MHQTDTLFHKKTGGMGFVFGFDVDNHAINTMPKETLIRITKAEDGGIGGKGLWKAGRPGMSPGRETISEALTLAGSILASPERESSVTLRARFEDDDPSGVRRGPRPRRTRLRPRGPMS